MNENKITYEKMKVFLTKNAIYIAIGLLSIVYIVSGFIKISETGKTLMQIVGESILVFLFSYFVIQAFSLQGIINGETSIEVKNARELFENVKNSLGSNISKLSNWVRLKNLQVEKEMKIEALCEWGITYEDFINDNFDKKKLTKKELKHINKIKHLKITKLSAGEIINNSYKRNNPLFLGKNKQNFLTQRSFSTLLTKLLFTLMFGYFSTSFIGLNLSELIWKLVQVVLFLIFGIMEYFRAYLFMTGEYVELIQKKTSLLKEFSDYLDKEKYNENIY